MTESRRDGLQRAGRTFIQLLAGGAFLELTQLLAGDLGAPYDAYLLALYSFGVAWAQNELEALGLLPIILKPKRERSDARA